jgi:hypothetical protein
MLAAQMMVRDNDKLADAGPGRPSFHLSTQLAFDAAPVLCGIVMMRHVLGKSDFVSFFRVNCVVMNGTHLSPCCISPMIVIESLDLNW